MATARFWIKKTVKDLHLDTAKLRGPGLEEFRSQIERSKLLERLETTHDLINEEAGGMILYQRLSLQPQDLMCKYTFASPRINYEMALALRENGPTLVFSLDKPNHAVRRAALGDYFRCLVHPREQAIKHELRVYPAIVNNIDLQEWFTYLLSGLRNSRKPLVKNCPVPRYS